MSFMVKWSCMEDKFEILMNGGEIIQSVSDELTYDTLYKSEENL